MLCDRREIKETWHHERFQVHGFEKEGMVNLGDCYSKKPCIMKTKNWPLDLARFQSGKMLKRANSVVLFGDKSHLKKDEERSGR